MLSSADALGKIQQYYTDGSRQVPYLTFMNVFNDLLADPVKIVPKEPTEELKEKFRAACMAVNIGIYDTEGRGDDRAREFREKILPVWKAKLPVTEFAKCNDILEGGMRAKAVKEEEKRAGADTVTESTSLKTADLLRRLGIAPDEKAGQEKPKAAAPAPAKAASPQQPGEEAFELESPGGVALEEPDTSEVLPPRQGGLPAVFASIDELVEALRQGRLLVAFSAREDAAPFARYRIGNQEVQVRLVDGNTRNYVIGAVGVGYARIPDGQKLLDGIAQDMGYRKTEDLTYRRKEGDFLLRFRIEPNRVDLPCGYPKGGGLDIAIQQLQKVHRDMGELLEMLAPQK